MYKGETPLFQLIQTRAICSNPIQFLQNCQKKYGDVFTFRMVGKKVTVLLGADGNQFVFNSKQNLSSAAEAYNDMTKYVFGREVVYDAPHSVFLEQKRFVCVATR